MRLRNNFVWGLEGKEELGMPFLSWLPAGAMTVLFTETMGGAQGWSWAGMRW